jgi:hypothetical protein
MILTSRKVQYINNIIVFGIDMSLLDEHHSLNPKSLTHDSYSVPYNEEFENKRKILVSRYSVINTQLEANRV